MVKFFRTKIVFVFLFVLLFAIQSHVSEAASWNGITPLKTSREEVEKILGAPVNSQDGILQFKVMGGIVTVAFVDEKFVTINKLPKESLGKVRQIVLQHENSNATPEDMKLEMPKSGFLKEQQGTKVTIYRNEKDGITYTFIDGTLKTTYYVAAASQLKGK